MPWITENDKTYWLPNVLPDCTEEHTKTQREKTYLTPSKEEKKHPQWTYSENNAYVDDEYLFKNEGWKLIINEEPKIRDSDLKKFVRNTSEKWQDINEYTLKVTYTLIDLSQDEIDKLIESKWKEFRAIRNFKLTESDWVIVRSLHENLIVSDEVLEYRKTLRNLPETIINILDFDCNNKSSWPSVPTILFKNN